MTDRVPAGELDARLGELAAQLKKQQNETAKLRRTFEDVIYNLDTENMPEVAALIARYRDESREAVARVEAKADEGGARIALLVGDNGEVDGSVIVQAINGQSALAIDADRIDLNGAVTANENFKIKTDGSVECRDLTLTGGRISIPCELGRREPVISAGDATSDRFAGIYSDRIYLGLMKDIDASIGDSTSLSPNSVVCTEADGYSADRAVRVGNLRGGSLEIVRTHYGADGEAIESGDNASVYISPDAIICQRIYETEVPEAMLSSLKPLYIDSTGRIWSY